MAPVMSHTSSWDYNLLETILKRDVVPTGRALRDTLTYSLIHWRITTWNSKPYVTAATVYFDFLWLVNSRNPFIRIKILILDAAVLITKGQNYIYRMREYVMH